MLPNHLANMGDFRRAIIAILAVAILTACVYLESMLAPIRRPLEVTSGGASESIASDLPAPEQRPPAGSGQM